MKTFNVLSPGGYCTIQELELIVRSFSELYFSVTNKHRTKMKLLLEVETNKFLKLVKAIGKKELPDAIELIDYKGFKSNLKKDTSVCFLPFTRNIENVVIDVLGQGVPVLSFDGLVQRQFVDNSCGLLVSQQSKEHNISDFASFLSMLYFDPEANKMLKKGALKRYQILQSQGKPSAMSKVALPQVA